MTTALILAAGFGTRLKPFTEKFPKPLVPVNGVPLILYTLAFLKSNGVRDIVINLHHHGAAVTRLLGNGHALGLKIRYSREPVILGTGGGIKKVLHMIKDDDLLVINGDVITDFDLRGLLSQHQTSANAVTMALYDHPEAKRFGLISFEGKSLTSFLGQPAPSAKAKHAMFASYHVVSKSRTHARFASLPDRKAFCIIRDVYVPEVLTGKKFGAFKLKGFWAVCDSLSDVSRTEEALTRQRKKLSYERELARLVKVVAGKPLLAKLRQARVDF